MKKIILLILFICHLNSQASAVVLFLARTEDPKRAEEIWVSNETANKAFLQRRRAELKKKHALKKVNLEAVIAKKDVISSKSPQTESLLSDSPITTEGDARARESKEIETH